MDRYGCTPGLSNSWIYFVTEFLPRIQSFLSENRTPDRFLTIKNTWTCILNIIINTSGNTMFFHHTPIIFQISGLSGCHNQAMMNRVIFSQSLREPNVTSRGSSIARMCRTRSCHRSSRELAFFLPFGCAAKHLCIRRITVGDDATRSG